MSVQDSSQIDPTAVAEDVAGIEPDDDVEAHGAKEWIAGLSTAVVLTGAGAGVAAASMSDSSAPRGTAPAAVGADVAASDARVPDTGSTGVIDPFETLDNDIDNTVYKASKDAEKLVRGITHDVATHHSHRAGAQVLRAVHQGGGMSNRSASDRLHLEVKASTQTVVRSSTVRAASYMPVEFTAQVASAHPGAIAPTGSVTFWLNDVRLGTVEVATDGTATLSTNELGTGAHDIVAQYNGDARHAASESLPLPQLVVDPSGPLSG